MYAPTPNVPTPVPSASSPPRRPGVGRDVRLLTRSSPGRREAERFIAERYRSEYGATLSHFLPTLVALPAAGGGLLAAAGIAIDIGRFYMERRFLQNAADAAALAAAGIGEATLRLSVGLEDADDLIDDLKRGFRAAAKG